MLPLLSSCVYESFRRYRSKCTSCFKAHKFVCDGVVPEEADMDSYKRRPTCSAKRGSGELGNADPIDLPSGKYGQVPEPSKVLLNRAAEPAHPVLPKQTVPKPMAKTMRERIPLASSLTGAGRAGKVGSLQGSSGSKYKGNVLAGRPHGKGQYFAPGVQPGRPLRLVYEGDFVKGAREGYGQCYYNNGEVYTGAWVCNKRTGQGKLTYVDGSVYEGMWMADRRHGVGTFYGTNGDIFVGNFMDDKRHGLGTTYMPSRGKKYVAEYVNDSPKCGSFFELSDAEVEAPPTQTLRDTIAAGRIAQEIKTGQPASHMPQLQLMQPSKVLAKEFVAVRQQRSKGKLADNTLPAESMSLLRHAFTLVAGGDDSAAVVLSHQLQELMVLAGLDPAAPAVVKLLGLLLDKAQQTSSTCCSTCVCAFGPEASSGAGAGAGAVAARHGGGLRLDDFLGVLCFFREQPLAVLEEQQAKQAAAEAVRRAAAAAAEFMEHAAAGPGVGENGHAEGKQQEEQEQWKEDDEGEGEEAAAEQHAESEEEAWGAATDDGMLERHIAQHRAPPAPPTATAAIEPSADETPTAETEATAGEPMGSAATEPSASSGELDEPAAAEQTSAAAEFGTTDGSGSSSSSQQSPALIDAAPETTDEQNAARVEGVLSPSSASEPSAAAAIVSVLDRAAEAPELELTEVCSSNFPTEQPAASSIDAIDASSATACQAEPSTLVAEESSCEGTRAAVSSSEAATAQQEMPVATGEAEPATAVHGHQAGDEGEWAAQELGMGQESAAGVVEDMGIAASEVPSGLQAGETSKEFTSAS